MSQVKSFFKSVANALYTMKRVVKFMLWYPAVALMPRNPKKILFGAWWGNQFSDNPKYFLKYILSLNQGFECYWFGNECIRSKVEAFPGVTFVKKGSLKARWHLLTAKWMVTNLGAECDVTNRFPTYGRIKQLTFWHGTAYKGVCNRDYHAELSKNPFKRFAQYFLSKDFSIAAPLWSWASFSFEEMRFLMPYEVPWQFKPEMSIAAGTARIDYLIQNKDNPDEIRRVKANIASMLGLPTDKRWILYMPTWRKGIGVNYSFMTSKRTGEINAILEKKNAILIEKQHPQVLQKNNIQGGWNGSIYMMSSDNALTDIDTQELLLSSDCLITDYSSCLCDFETMDRPVIHYVYDYKEYTSTERTDYHDVHEYAAGPVAFSEDEFIQALAMDDAAMLAVKGPKAGDLVAAEKGHACETFAKWVGLIP